MAGPVIVYIYIYLLKVVIFHGDFSLPEGKHGPLSIVAMEKKTFQPWSFLSGSDGDVFRRAVLLEDGA